jgi:hypothetical protein
MTGCASEGSGGLDVVELEKAIDPYIIFKNKMFIFSNESRYVSSAASEILHPNCENVKNKKMKAVKKLFYYDFITWYTF